MRKGEKKDKEKRSEQASGWFAQTRAAVWNAGMACQRAKAASIQNASSVSCSVQTWRYCDKEWDCTVRTEG